MKKLLTLALLSATMLASPVLAADSDAIRSDQQDVQSDKGAISKDDAALAKDRENRASNRATKAEDKAEGNYGKQAVDSVKIGANDTAIGEKKAERGADRKILKHHKKNLHKDETQSQSDSNTTAQ